MEFSKIPQNASHKEKLEWYSCNIVSLRNVPYFAPSFKIYISTGELGKIIIVVILANSTNSIQLQTRKSRQVVTILDFTYIKSLFKKNFLLWLFKFLSRSTTQIDREHKGLGFDLHYFFRLFHETNYIDSSETIWIWFKTVTRKSIPLISQEEGETDPFSFESLDTSWVIC